MPRKLLPETASHLRWSVPVGVQSEKSNCCEVCSQGFVNGEGEEELENARSWKKLEEPRRNQQPETLRNRTFPAATMGPLKGNLG